MSRGLGTTNAAQVQASVVRPVVFCELAFVGGTVRAHSSTGTITWGSNTWQGVGEFSGVSEIEEGVDIAARGVTLSLSGIPSFLLNEAIAAQYRGRPAKLWLGFLDSSSALLADPYQVFGGRMDVMTIEDTGDTCSISVQCENRLIDLRRPRVSRYTNSEQMARYPTDYGLVFVSRLADLSLYWGVQNSATAPQQAAPRSVNTTWRMH